MNKNLFKILVTLLISGLLAVFFIQKDSPQDVADIASPNSTSTSEIIAASSSEEDVVSSTSATTIAVLEKQPQGSNQVKSDEWYMVPELKVKFKNPDGLYDDLFYVYDKKDDSVQFYDKRWATLTPFCAPSELATHGTLVRFSKEKYEEARQQIMSQQSLRENELPWWLSSPAEKLPQGYSSSSAFMIGDMIFDFYRAQDFCIPDELRQKYIDTIVREQPQFGFTNNFLFQETLEPIR
jgi:hypothetical protein